LLFETRKAARQLASDLLGGGTNEFSKESVMAQYTLSGRTIASGMGAEKSACKELLFALCKSGCTIPEVEVIPVGMGRTILQYKVEGDDSSIEIFRKHMGI
jgi:hypothetical protein